MTAEYIFSKESLVDQTSCQKHWVRYRYIRKPLWYTGIFFTMYMQYNFVSREVAHLITTFGGIRLSRTTMFLQRWRQWTEKLQYWHTSVFYGPSFSELCDSIIFPVVFWVPLLSQLYRSSLLLVVFTGLSALLIVCFVFLLFSWLFFLVPVLSQLCYAFLLATFLCRSGSILELYSCNNVLIVSKLVTLNMYVWLSWMYACPVLSCPDFVLTKRRFNNKLKLSTFVITRRPSMQ